ncbi:MAG: ABC transporter ATP-binding protein [Acidobacteriaceae bacterium]
MIQSQSLAIESEAMLEVRGLNIFFGLNQAVRDVTFSIAAGGSLAVAGESSSGKSVTSLAVMRLLPPQARTEGSIRFGDTEIMRASSEQMRRIRGAQISMIFQEPMTALNPVMRVGDQVTEAIHAHHSVSKREAWARAVAALDEVAIRDPQRRARDYPHQLSGGQRQRVMIAMAIVNRPKLLIADEPTTALDVTVQSQILELLAQLRAQHGLAMLFISHDFGVVSRVADRIAVMFRGSIVEMAPTKELIRHPQHAYTRGLLASVPSLRSDRAQPLARIGTVERDTISNQGELREFTPDHLVRG